MLWNEHNLARRAENLGDGNKGWRLTSGQVAGRERGGGGRRKLLAALLLLPGGLVDFRAGGRGRRAAGWSLYAPPTPSSSLSCPRRPSPGFPSAPLLLAAAGGHVASYRCWEGLFKRQRLTAFFSTVAKKGLFQGFVGSSVFCVHQRASVSPALGWGSSQLAADLGLRGSAANCRRAAEQREDRKRAGSINMYLFSVAEKTRSNRFSSDDRWDHHSIPSPLFGTWMRHKYWIQGMGGGTGPHFSPSGCHCLDIRMRCTKRRNSDYT